MNNQQQRSIMINTNTRKFPKWNVIGFWASIGVNWTKKVKCWRDEYNKLRKQVDEKKVKKRSQIPSVHLAKSDRK